MISFLLNDQLIETDKPSGMALVDFIRYESDLKATKIGCREGDCGACIVLEGTLKDAEISYQTITSCLHPLANAHGKHIVTLEGMNINGLSPVQHALVENNGTQCGFCTPGFVMSLSCFLLSKSALTYADAIASIDGNICRCTGYKSIERAAKEIVEFKTKFDNKNPVIWLVENNYLPNYFTSAVKRLHQIARAELSPFENQRRIAGGTDLMVQKADELYEYAPDYLSANNFVAPIEESKTDILIPAKTTISELLQSDLFIDQFPKLEEHFNLIASTPIRNMGTLAGNIVNASPIGDLSIFFLALNADLYIRNQKDDRRRLPLKDFFKGYKKMDLRNDEFIEAIGFKKLRESQFFNFEKVSKRQFLDIASVNSAMLIRLNDAVIEEISLSAGGVSPVPLFLKKTSHFLNGKKLSADLLTEASSILNNEITPISDVRGSKEYKSLLLKQLFYAHFIKLFPEKFSIHQLTATAQ